MNQYVIDFSGYIFSNIFDKFRELDIKNPQRHGDLWIVEMDSDSLVVFVLKYPKATIYRKLRKE